MYVYCNYNNTKLQLVLESIPEPNEDPVSTQDPISTNDPTPVDADNDTADEQAEVEPPTAAEIVEAGLQQGDLCDESISVDRRGR